MFRVVCGLAIREGRERGNCGLLGRSEWRAAGCETEYSSGGDETVLTKYSQMVPSKVASLVGSKLPNGWGLHDMHGNVFEWSFDKLDKNDSEGLNRMSRGGGWNHGAMPPLSRDLQNE